MRAEMQSEVPLAELVMQYATGDRGKRSRPPPNAANPVARKWHRRRQAAAQQRWGQEAWGRSFQAAFAEWERGGIIDEARREWIVGDGAS